jgi:CheY-like chemotaxis protein
VVIDDNELNLPGFERAFGQRAEIELVAACDHEAALAWAGDWASVDVVVLDAADEDRVGDQFPGVAVVRRIRASAGSGAPVVVVVTGHYFHDGLRHRMRAAGADLFFLRSDIRSNEALVDIVLQPGSYRRPVPVVADAGRPCQLGLAPDSDLEGFLGYVEAQGLGPVLDHRAGRPEPRSRRWSRHREAAAVAGRIEPVNLTTGDRPRGHDIPSIRQLKRLWDWAARVKRPGS